MCTETVQSGDTLRRIVLRNYYVYDDRGELDSERVVRVANELLSWNPCLRDWVGMRVEQRVFELDPGDGQDDSRPPSTAWTNEARAGRDATLPASIGQALDSDGLKTIDTPLQPESPNRPIVLPMVTGIPWWHAGGTARPRSYRAQRYWGVWLAGVILAIVVGVQSWGRTWIPVLTLESLQSFDTLADATARW